MGEKKKTLLSGSFKPSAPKDLTLVHHLFYLPKIGGGGTTICFSLLEFVSEYNHSLSYFYFFFFWSFHSLSAALHPKTHRSTFYSTAASIHQSFRTSDCLLKKKTDSFLEFQCLFIVYRTVILDNFEFILVWVLRKGIDYSSSPIKYIPNLLLYGIVKLQTKQKLVTYFLVTYFLVKIKKEIQYKRYFIPLIIAIFLIIAVLKILWKFLYLCFINMSPVIGLNIFSFGIFKIFGMIFVSFVLRGSMWGLCNNNLTQSDQNL